MNHGIGESAKTGRVNPQQIVETISDKLFAAADNRAVFGEPVVSGNYTVITASEVGSGGGGGGGGGFAPDPEYAAPEGQTAEAQRPEASAGGSGVGMGGGAYGRPVAVVVIGPAGVEVKPVFDATKIGLALATTLGAMVLMLGRMRRAR